MSDCVLCPRNCHANRMAGERGYCGETDEIRAARAALHMWEEPCISGKNGSGTIFFTGCALGCVYCQNKTISGGTVGKDITVDRLVEIFFELKEQGAHNINLVTAGHFLPQVCLALERLRGQFDSLKSSIYGRLESSSISTGCNTGVCGNDDTYKMKQIPDKTIFCNTGNCEDKGMPGKEGIPDIPIVYNTSCYEKPGSLRMAEGLIDIYLPDFKYLDPALAAKYSHAPDYPEVAKAALAEMLRQVGEPVFDDEGMMRRGVIVRHLVLPGQTDDSKAVIRYLHETYGDSIYISIMNQYTPMPGMEPYPELTRRVTAEEYDSVVDYAISIGVENGFIQEGGTAEESFIPPFDITGI
ncbi:MAG: radical SAM protein [Clostridiales bacterium]|nr:radical SAM protein [Clostridiales bacterium]